MPSVLFPLLPCFVVDRWRRRVIPGGDVDVIPGGDGDVSALLF